MWPSRPHDIIVTRGASGEVPARSSPAAAAPLQRTRSMGWLGLLLIAVGTSHLSSSANARGLKPKSPKHPVLRRPASLHRKWNDLLAWNASGTRAIPVVHTDLLRAGVRDGTAVCFLTKPGA